MKAGCDPQRVQGLAGGLGHGAEVSHDDGFADRFKHTIGLVEAQQTCATCKVATSRSTSP